MSVTYLNRKFQLWEYRVSHGSLLVRSPKGHDTTTNVDLVFDGVEYICCPRMLRGVELVAATAEDIQRVRQHVGEVREPDRLFVLVSDGARHFIVASSCRIDEHTADIFNSPFA